ncbi:MAG TPA: class I SAM-dependent methyltransferase [Bacteroidota bacterium]|nr:class I SAM-dependent methyltransferase [Bacteroidota bacterium]
MLCYHALLNDAYHPLYLLLHNERELDRMERDGDRVQKTVARVVREVRTHLLSPEESVWRDSIESMRGVMNHSDERLSIADYGAQSPLRKLTDAEMYAGRIVHRTVGEICRSSSKPLKWSLFLFKLIRSFAPDRCLELGTCLGISGAYIAAAMSLNKNGRLVTIEGADTLAERAKKNFSTLGFSSIETVTGRFRDVLPQVLAGNESFDMVFIDGHHDGPSTLQYFETIEPTLRDDAIVIFDDIAWSKEMHDAWKLLQQHKRVRFSIDMFEMGVCCIGTPSHQRFRIAV